MTGALAGEVGLASFGVLGMERSSLAQGDHRGGASGGASSQHRSVSNAAMLRASRLNSTPVRRICRPGPRYLSA